MQRHHLLPLQLLRHSAFAAMFGAFGPVRRIFDDFRHNGLLLPAQESAARRTGLPMHRGPHRRYNELVIERVGQIESGWSRASARYPAIAANSATMRIQLLGRALRQRLLAQGQRPLQLNRYDPIGTGFDFSDLDALADGLWSATER